MQKIATHDSATGEKGMGLISWMVTPFSRTQSKTIKEQLEAGCTYFDLRAIKRRNGEWHCAHGLWTSEKTFSDILYEIAHFSIKNEVQIYINVTYERWLKTVQQEREFIEFIESFRPIMQNIQLCFVNVKLPKWHVIKCYQGVKARDAFFKLDGHSWHTFMLPIPWLWKKVYYPTHEFNEDTYSFVDFL